MTELPTYEIPDQFAGLDDSTPAPILVREWKRLIHDANWWMQNAVGHKADADASRARRDFAVASEEAMTPFYEAAQTAVGLARLHLMNGEAKRALEELDRCAVTT